MHVYEQEALSPPTEMDKMKTTRVTRSFNSVRLLPLCRQSRDDYPGRVCNKSDHNRTGLAMHRHILSMKQYSDIRRVETILQSYQQYFCWVPTERLLVRRTKSFKFSIFSIMR